uniref:G-protein coupled receptors family 1 profile domain-containing protein n=1 Tax=Amphiprion ocellaris TaxID=80972 RepID=A0AAQ5XU94_AMPOC
MQAECGSLSGGAFTFLELILFLLFNLHIRLTSLRLVKCHLMSCHILFLPTFLLCSSKQLGFCSGTLFVTLMSVDRYLAIVHAVAAIQARTLRYGITASVITWVISVIMATPQVVFASLEMDGDDSHCHPIYPEDNQYFWKMQQNFSKNTVGLFVCLPIIVFCYVKILVVLSNVCVFVVCWVPYNVLVFLQTLEQLGVLNNCNVSKAISSAMGFAEIIALSHCCINPVVYAFVRENFRKSLARVLSCP